MEDSINFSSLDTHDSLNSLPANVCLNRLERKMWHTPQQRDALTLIRENIYFRTINRSGGASSSSWMANKHGKQLELLVCENVSMEFCL